MKPNRRIGTLWALLLAALFAGQPGISMAELVREPVWAGKFYPASPEKLAGDIAQLTRRARQTPVSTPPGKRLRALILPHAGYIYSGWTAAHAAIVLDTESFDKVVLIGPDHRVGFQNAAVSDAKAWETPMGLVPLHRDARMLLEKNPLFQRVPASDRQEHSLEVILPFLQVYLKRFQLVPIVMGYGDLAGMAEAVDAVVDDGTLLVVSSDLSHYLPYEQAVERDRETIDIINRYASGALMGRENAACGTMPILTAIHLAKKRGWQPATLHYSNSGDTAGERDRVVGYAAIAFYGDAMNQQGQTQDNLSEEKGRLLIQLARQTIAKRLGQTTGGAGAETAPGALDDPEFMTPRGTFVTLKKGGQLRGCIGSLTADEPLRQGVEHNAVNAAFRDPRFPPLSADELDRVEIEVSILTEPRPLAFTDADDLLRKLRVNVDGVIIRKGGARATFLPQVWEQLPQPAQFLSHLCTKAGLPSDAWKKPGLEVSTYQVQYFEEHR